jgi:serine protease Do
LNIFVFALGLAMAAVASPAMADDGAFIGLQVQGISPAVSDALGMPGMGGVLVRDVALHGPAAKAGIKRGDLIVRIGNTPISTFDDLIRTVQELKVSTEAAIQVRRGSESAVLSLQPGRWPDGWRVTRSAFGSLPSVGVTLSSLTDPVRQRFTVPWGITGVIVTLIDPAAAGGVDLKPGEVITQVNQAEVVDPNQLIDAYQKAKVGGGKNLLVLVAGAGGYRFSLIPVR